MLPFVWGLIIIWNTATILKDELENHKNDEWSFNQSESSLQNYTMSDLQVRLGIPDINIVKNIRLCSPLVY